MKALLAALLVFLSPFAAAQGPAQKPTATQVDALVALARTYGVVRYFHPSDSLDRVKWERFLVHAAGRMGSVSADAEIASRLQELFAPIVEGFRVAPAGAEVTAPRGDGPIVEWRHLGYGLETDPSLPYASWRTHHPPIGDGRNKGSYLQHRTTAERPVHADPVMRVRLPRGLEAHVAVSMPMSAVKVGEAQGKLLDALEAALPALDAAADPVDQARAWADGIAAWNLAAHFYPQWSLLSIDWEAQLRAWLAAQPPAQSRASLREALRRLTAPLDDGHVSILDPADKSPRHFLPISVRPLGDRWVVDASRTERVKAGDVIVAIDGRPAAAWFAQRMALISGSPQHKRWAVAAELLGGAKGSAVALRLQRAGAASEVKLTRDTERAMRGPRAGALQEVRPDIHYVDVSRFDKAEFDKALPQLAKARGIVFDLRGYPAREAHALVSYWVTGTDGAQWMFVPRFDKPFAHSDAAWSFGWQKPRDEALAAPAKVALVDARTIDYGESLAAYFPAQKTGPMLGSPTAGANGNVARATLPSGMQLFFTGMRVTRHDGSVYHREGLKPGEPVEPTLAGIAASRDEVLERAISQIEKNNPR